MIIIKDILEGSPAQVAGLKAGDKIIEINKHPIKDEIDFKFYSSEEYIRIKILRENKEKFFRIEKDFHESLGIEFHEMNLFSCGTDCIFCFVQQNPKGLRASLYFKDGDYRMSFLYGNYITLTNVGPNSLKRIVDQGLSPIYVSVHSTLPDIRMRYMNLRKDDKILEKLGYLIKNNIKIHAQIVLTPGINDGDSLMKTIDDLFQLSEGIESLAIVPVGLTKHRKGLEKLKRVNKVYSKSLIDTIKPIQNKIKDKIGRTWVYLSDEFYLLAGHDIPGNEYYDEYPQIENGVGMCRIFYDQFQKAKLKFPAKLQNRKEITFATGLLAYKFLNNEIVPELNKIQNLEVKLTPVKNLLFGSQVTVSGLLSMKCLIKGLQSIDLGDLLVLPENILNHEGVFLDDGTPEELSKILNIKIYIFKDNWKGLFKYTENL